MYIQTIYHVRITLTHNIQEGTDIIEQKIKTNYRFNKMCHREELISKLTPLTICSVPAVCCCRRATSSQRRFTTISWPLVAGQLWLVSTDLPFLLLLFTICSPCGCGRTVSRQQQARAEVAEGSLSQCSVQLRKTYFSDVIYYEADRDTLISPSPSLTPPSLSTFFLFF